MEIIRATTSCTGANQMAVNDTSASSPEKSVLNWHKVFTSPVRIASIEVWRVEGSARRFPFHRPTNDGELYFIRSTSTDGATGIAIAHDRIGHLYPILQQLVIPYFTGKDARDLEGLVDGVYVHRSNYKLAGLALWCCVGWVECSLLDLLGRAANKPVGELLGGVVRREIPVYLSSLRRDTKPEEEVAFIGQRLAETGAVAVKFKIGGRMSKNADAAFGRTERLVHLARKTLGDSIAIHVDANGSYDAARAIQVGEMLEAHDIVLFEEPCPFDDFEATKRVADTLSLPVAAGEQETSLARFEWMIRHRVVDIVQPDLNYNGGFFRTMRVARTAAAAGVPLYVHNARLGAHTVYTLHFASCVQHLGKYQEYNAALPHGADAWVTPTLQVRNGALQVPEGPGFGVGIDFGILRRAKRL